MTHTKLAVFAFTVFGAFACGEDRNLVGKGNPDGAAGSGGSLASSDGGGTGGSGGVASSSGAIGSGGILGSGGAIGSGGTMSSSGRGGSTGGAGAMTSGGATTSSGGATGTGGRGGASGGAGGVGTGGMTGAGGQTKKDAAVDGNPDVPMSNDAQILAELCVSTGGKVETLQCCAGVGAFPDSCLTGACGCAPTYSQPLTVCTCPAGTCFLPTTGCVPRDSDAGGAGKDGGALDTSPDVSSDSLSSDCPSSIPSGACSLAQDTLCYYGDDSRWFCKTSALCTKGAWKVTLPLTGCTGSPPAVCPADPALPPASICSADGGMTETCVYGTKYCQCGYAGTASNQWVCNRDLPAECPALPPAEASPCTAQVLCIYGPTCSGHALECADGKWVTRLLDC